MGGQPIVSVFEEEKCNRGQKSICILQPKVFCIVLYLIVIVLMLKGYQYFNCV